MMYSKVCFVAVSGMLFIAISGCQRSVTAVEPRDLDHPSAHQNPVAFKIKFGSRADTNTFSGVVGYDTTGGFEVVRIITGEFPANMTAGNEYTATIDVCLLPSHELVCRGERCPYKFKVSAHMTSSQMGDSTGHALSFPAIFPLCGAPPATPPPSPGSLGTSSGSPSGGSAGASVGTPSGSPSGSPAGSTPPRAAGAFVFEPAIGTPTSDCGTNVSAVYANAGAPNDNRVTFTVGSAPPTPPIPAVYYLFSKPPSCVGVVLHPLINHLSGAPQPPSLTWYNLGFDPSLGRGPAIRQKIKNLYAFNWHQFWFSPDQMLFLLVEKLPLETPASPWRYKLHLYDTPTGDKLDSVKIEPRSIIVSPNDPIADICDVQLASTTGKVAVTYRDRQSQPPTCQPPSVSRGNCKTGAPDNCSVSTINMSP